MANIPWEERPMHAVEKKRRKLSVPPKNRKGLCGTRAGYLKHLRSEPRENPCRACRKANTLYHRQYRKERGRDQ